MATYLVGTAIGQVLYSDPPLQARAMQIERAAHVEAHCHAVAAIESPRLVIPAEWGAWCEGQRGISDGPTCAEIHGVALTLDYMAGALDGVDPAPAPNSLAEVGAVTRWLSGEVASVQARKCDGQ